jgi:hypothetical protein
MHLITHRASSRTSFARWLLALSSFFLAFLVVEAGFRVVGYGDPLSAEDLVMTWEPRSPYRWHDDDQIRVVLEPGFDGAMVYRRASDGAVLLRSDVQLSSLGLRHPELEPQPAPGTQRILALGDSVTFGDGVPQGRLFTTVLAERLATGQPVEVINAGIPSWNLQQQVAWLERYGLDLHPDVVLQFYYINDLDPPWYDAGPEPLPADLPMEAPPWARRESGLRRASFLVNQVFRTLERRRLARDLEAWGRRGEHSVGFLDAVRTNWNAGRAEGLFRRMGSAAESRGVRVVVVVLPVFEPIQAGEATDLLAQVAAAAQAAGLPVLRLDDAVDGMPFHQRAVMPGDPHPSAAAHRRLGTALAERLPPYLLEPGGRR